VEYSDIAEQGIERFLQGRLSPHENQRIVRGLLAGRLPEERPAALAVAPTYDSLFEQLGERLAEAESRIAQEREAAPRLWTFLEPHPQMRRQVIVRNDRRLQTWGLYELLLERAKGLAESQPAAAADFADLAVTLASNLDPEVYGMERIADFRTTALSVLGNARRLAGDLVAARIAFQQARLSLEFGSGDPIEEANLSALLVHLLCDLGEYEKAAQALERASSLYRRAGEPGVPLAELPPSLREERIRQGDKGTRGQGDKAARG
jgi:tetratricopeptide (TPR) repeat protein